MRSSGSSVIRGGGAARGPGRWVFTPPAGAMEPHAGRLQVLGEGCANGSPAGETVGARVRQVKLVGALCGFRRVAWACLKRELLSVRAPAVNWVGFPPQCRLECL